MTKLTAKLMTTRYFAKVIGRLFISPKTESGSKA